MRKKAVAGLMILVLMASGCSKAESKESTASVSTEEESAQSSHATVSTVALTKGKYSEEDLDDIYDESSAGKITFGTDGAVSQGNGIAVDGSDVTISAEGTYIVTGETQDGSLTIDLKNDGEVKIVLNNASLICTDGAAIQGINGKVTVTLAENSVNYIEDGQTYENVDADNEPGAAIFCKDDLTFNGTGSLEVKANYNNAIQSKDDLKFISGTYTVNAKDNGLVGKDSVTVRDGSYKITSGKDGIRATNAKESDKGYIIADGGSFSIEAGGDGVQAETLLLVNDGDFTVTSGGGSENAAAQQGNMGEMRGMGGGKMESGTRPNRQEMQEGKMPEGEATEGMTPPDAQNTDSGSTPPENAEKPDKGTQSEEGGEEQNTTAQEEESTVSTKALKSYVDIQLNGGSFTIDACDDAVHSNGTVTVNGGTFTIQTGDDGIHADESLTINNGTIQIDQSYEGLESLDIAINNGNISIMASDDGINAAGDNDTAANPEAEDEQGFRKTGMGMEESQGAAITINGGSLTVNASGDGLDANGSIIMTDGTVIVQGLTSGGDGTFDYVDGFHISGGTLLAVGSQGMVQTPDKESSQPVIVWNADAVLAEGTEITVINSSGETVMKMTTVKESQWVCLSDPELEKGETYTVTAGEIKKTVTLNDMINNITGE